MKILTIEDVFEIPKRGLVLVPDIRKVVLRHPPTHVTLVSKEGVKRRVEAEFILPHFDPLVREVGYFCILKSIHKSEVEIGTEVRINEDMI
jgi:hypothetical protein